MEIHSRQKAPSTVGACLGGAPVVFASFLIAAASGGCTFDSGLAGTQCDVPGARSADGNRRCENGFWVAIDARGPGAFDGRSDGATGRDSASVDTAPRLDTGGVDTGQDVSDIVDTPTGDGESPDIDGGDVDTCVPQTWYRDRDGDGYGRDDDTRTACDKPQGYVARADDCDDGDDAVHPGAAESCNGNDDDCDGVADSQRCYGGVSGTAGVGICAEDTQVCRVGSLERCEDTIHRTHPETAEVTCQNGRDDDCDGTRDDCFFRATFGGSRWVVSDIAVHPSSGAMFATGTLPDAFFVARYGPSGALRWRETVSSREIDANGIALDPGGSRLYVAGVAAADVAGESVDGSHDGFVATYDLSGTRRELDLVGTSSVEELRDVAYDAGNDRIVVAGVTHGDWEGSNQGSADAVLAAYDRSMEAVWVQQFGSGGYDIVEALDVDANGEIYVGVDTAGAIASGATPQGGGDLVVAKFDPSGSRAWLEQFGSSGDDDIRGVSVADGKGAYFVGETEGGLRGLTHGGDDDGYLFKYRADGTFAWIDSFNSRRHEDLDAVRYDGDSGTIYAAGSAAAELPGTVFSGRYDVLVTAYAPDGTRKWVELRGTGRGDDGLAVGNSPNSSLLVIGGTWNSGGGFVERLK